MGTRDTIDAPKESRVQRCLRRQLTCGLTLMFFGFSGPHLLSLWQMDVGPSFESILWRNFLLQSIGGVGIALLVCWAVGVLTDISITRLLQRSR